MRSDSIFSYVKLLLILLSILVLASIGYSGYVLFQDIQDQRPRLTYNATHVTIEGLTIKNRGLYPINLSLTIQVIGDGQLVSESRVSKEVMPRETKDLSFSLPIPSDLEYSKMSLNFLIDLGLPPFVHMGLNFSQPLPAVIKARSEGLSLVPEEGHRATIRRLFSSLKGSIKPKMIHEAQQIMASLERYQQARPHPVYDEFQVHVKNGGYILILDGQSYGIPVVMS